MKHLCLGPINFEHSEFSRLIQAGGKAVRMKLRSVASEEHESHAHCEPTLVHKVLKLSWRPVDELSGRMLDLSRLHITRINL